LRKTQNKSETQNDKEARGICNTLSKCDSGCSLLRSVNGSNAGIIYLVHFASAIFHQSSFCTLPIYFKLRSISQIRHPECTIVSKDSVLRQQQTPRSAAPVPPPLAAATIPPVQQASPNPAVAERTKKLRKAAFRDNSPRAVKIYNGRSRLRLSTVTRLTHSQQSEQNHSGYVLPEKDWPFVANSRPNKRVNRSWHSWAFRLLMEHQNSDRTTTIFISTRNLHVCFVHRRRKEGRSSGFFFAKDLPHFLLVD